MDLLGPPPTAVLQQGRELHVQYSDQPRASSPAGSANGADGSAEGAAGEQLPGGRAVNSFFSRRPSLRRSVAAPQAASEAAPEAVPEAGGAVLTGLAGSSQEGGRDEGVGGEEEGGSKQPHARLRPLR